MSNCTPLPKAAKPVWANQLTRRQVSICELSSMRLDKNVKNYYVELLLKPSFWGEVNHFIDVLALVAS